MQRLKTEVQERQAKTAELRGGVLKMKNHLARVSRRRGQVSDGAIKEHVDSIWPGLWNFVTDSLGAEANETQFGRPQHLHQHLQ